MVTFRGILFDVAVAISGLADVVVKDCFLSFAVDVFLVNEVNKLLILERVNESRFVEVVDMSLLDVNMVLFQCVCKFFEIKTLNNYCKFEKRELSKQIK